MSESHPLGEGAQENIERVFTLKNEHVEVEIDSRGGFVNCLKIDGVDIIIPRTKDNPDRSGIPCLGPTPGPVEGTEWGKRYPDLARHGYERKLLWSVAERSKTGLVLETTESSPKFAGMWHMRLVVQLLPTGVSITREIRNLWNEPPGEDKKNLPHKMYERGFAFHPYLDNVGSPVRFPPESPFNTDMSSLPQGIVRKSASHVSFRKGQTKIHLRFSPPPLQIVDWSDAPDKYRCIEPWWARRGEGVEFGPSETKTFTMEISAEKIRMPDKQTAVQAIKNDIALAHPGILREHILGDITAAPSPDLVLRFDLFLTDLAETACSLGPDADKTALIEAIKKTRGFSGLFGRTGQLEASDETLGMFIELAQSTFEKLFWI